MPERARGRGKRTAKVAELSEHAELSDGCLAMIAEQLQRLGCKCGPQAHQRTPPMMYPEWIVCVLRSKLEPLRLALEAFVTACDTAPPVQLLAHLTAARAQAGAALATLSVAPAVPAKAAL